MKKRCPWVPTDNQAYIDYHDNEWGIPVHDDRVHFEFLVLEGAQAGLSWSTILQRRDGYRKAFSNFDPNKVAAYSKNKVQDLLTDPGIIRNKLKVKSTVSNAAHFLEIQNEFGSFDKYIWSFVKYKVISHSLRTLEDYPVYIPQAERLSNNLKKRGFSFCGPTIMYAYMQACGLVNDHVIDCFHRI